MAHEPDGAVLMMTFDLARLKSS